MKKKGVKSKCYNMLMTQLFFLRNKKSMEMAWKELGEFEKVAGPSVNKNKTVMRWINGKQHTCCKWDLSEFDL